MQSIRDQRFATIVEHPGVQRLYRNLYGDAIHPGQVLQMADPAWPFHLCVFTDRKLIGSSIGQNSPFFTDLYAAGEKMAEAAARRHDILAARSSGGIIKTLLGCYAAAFSEFDLTDDLPSARVVQISGPCQWEDYYREIVPATLSAAALYQLSSGHTLAIEVARQRGPTAGLFYDLAQGGNAPSDAPLPVTAISLGLPPQPFSGHRS